MVFNIFGTLIGIFIKYGLIGLLLSSFLSSLFFIPAYASFLIPLYIGLKFNPWQILIVLTIGAIAGEILNYYFGFYGSKYFIKQEKQIRKAEKWLDKWGEMSVFIVNLIPIFPADLVNVLVGFFRMDLKMFMISMSFAKFIQYSLLIFGLETLFKYVSFI